MKRSFSRSPSRISGRAAAWCRARYRWPRAGGSCPHQAGHAVEAHQRRRGQAGDMRERTPRHGKIAGRQSRCPPPRWAFRRLVVRTQVGSGCMCEPVRSSTSSLAQPATSSAPATSPRTGRTEGKRFLRRNLEKIIRRAHPSKKHRRREQKDERIAALRGSGTRLVVRFLIVHTPSLPS